MHEEALNAVPGDGNIDSEIVFIGEAPGRNEDETGMPFVGRAGKLLEESLKEIGYSRKDVWIGNIIKHRPPTHTLCPRPRSTGSS
ncbi:MAG: uracil-DNA glycosylase [Candidatus Fermentibacteraceae bacterium]